MKDAIRITRDTLEAIAALPAVNDVRIIVQAIIAYGMNGVQDVDIPEHLQFGWLLIRKELEQQRKHDSMVSTKRSEAVKKRWEIQKHTNVYKCIQMYTNVSKRIEEKNLPLVSPPSSPPNTPSYITPTLNPSLSKEGQELSSQARDVRVNTNTADNTDSISGDLFPMRGDESENGKNELSSVKEEIRHRINAIFHRRETTTWSENETKQLNIIAKRKDVLEELAEIEKLYFSNYAYKRHDIKTFLNNWTVEYDRALNRKNEQQKGYGAVNANQTGRYIVRHKA